VPIRYSLDRVHRRLVTHADGVVTFHEINAHLDMEQRNRDLEVPELFDARGATTDLTADQVRHLVDRATHMLRVAELGATAIVTTNAALYGMARMYALLASRAGVPAEAFGEVAAASRWLDQFSDDAD
jgi:CRISPR/Cas system CSM-associated protein Csm2 small subunit